jgi:hypothetical protein
VLVTTDGDGADVVGTGDAMVGVGGSMRGIAVVGTAFGTGVGAEVGAVVGVLRAVCLADVVGCGTVARTFSSAGALGTVGLG